MGCVQSDDSLVRAGANLVTTIGGFPFGPDCEEDRDPIRHRSRWHLPPSRPLAPVRDSALSSILGGDGKRQAGEHAATLIRATPLFVLNPSPDHDPSS